MSEFTKEIPRGLYDKMDFTFNNYEIKLAEDEKEYDETLRLRYEVFNVEMGEGLSSSEATGRDEDEYDKYCDHLIVKDLDNNNKIVGTYRILSKKNASAGIGFYSETEFDLTNLKTTNQEILELGRSCVHKDYRSKNIMSYLWAGMARYIDLTNTVLLFGCGSIHTNNIEEISKVYKYFKEKHYAEEKYRVYPLEKNKIKNLNTDIEIENTKEIFKLIPPILKGYIRVSAKCCGEPAWDPEFGCADLLVMADTEKITRKYVDHFFYRK